MAEQSPAADPSDVSDAIGELARARRERVIEAVLTTQPPWLESIEVSEITYFFRVPSIPFRQMDPQAFIEALRDAYGLILGKLDPSPLLREMPREELARLSDREIFERLVRAGGAITLTNGKFTQRNDFYAINFVRVNYESVMVQVGGPTIVAAIVAQDVAETIWAAVGVNKQWPAIEPGLMLIGYGTSTSVSLPAGSHFLLNPKLWNFLNGNLNEGLAFARDLRAKPAPGGAPPVRIIGVPSFESLDIRIGILNLITGYDSPASLKFRVATVGERGGGRVLVTSQLAYERHLELLGRLFDSLGT
jgi:hypothetical protein